MMTSSDYRKYFESRLAGQRLGSRPEIMARCPLHDDATPSLSVNQEKGVWKCWAGCGGGGVIEFEMKFANCDRDTAKGNVYALLGKGNLFHPAKEPEAIYQYHDANGILVFEKLRYADKHFVLRRPEGRGWLYNVNGVKKPLYHLPEILTSREILITEGEKDADNALAALKPISAQDGAFLAATTNFDGAGKWNDADSIYFAGKKGIILADNDEVGRKHAERVAQSIYPVALVVKVVHFPELPEKGDVSDFLEKHTGEELLKRINAAPRWRPSEPTSNLLVTAPEFLKNRPVDFDWIVQGVIERGANGVIVADPKAGKSFAAADLSVSLAIGAENWLGLNIPRSIRVALISREDNPSLTAWRIRSLFAGKATGNPSLLEQNLWVNTRQQSAQYQLDHEEQYAEMLEELKRRKPELLVLDVFNVLHNAQENDNTEMRLVLAKLTNLQAQVGCSIALVHHFTKSDVGGIVRRMRGSSAISGWAEWIIGISIADEMNGIRRMDFEVKAGQPPDPIHFRIETEQGGVARLARADGLQTRARNVDAILNRSRAN